MFTKRSTEERYNHDLYRIRAHRMRRIIQYSLESCQHLGEKNEQGQLTSEHKPIQKQIEDFLINFGNLLNQFENKLENTPNNPLLQQSVVMEWSHYKQDIAQKLTAIKTARFGCAFSLFFEGVVKSIG